MKKLNDNIKAILFAATFPLLGALYPLLNNPGIKTYSLVTDLDRSTPFLKVFILPYIAWYPYVIIPLIYFFFSDRKVFYKVILMLDICLIAAFSTFVVYQTTVARPVLAENDALTNMVRFIYNRDMPYNCFPSLHVIETYIMMKAVWVMEKRNTYVNMAVQIIGILIILSTVFIKQHVILDIVYGMLLVEAAFILVYRYRRGKAVQRIRSSFASVMMSENL